MFGFFGNPLEKMGGQPELPPMEIMETEGCLLWRGKQFSRGTEDFEFTIRRDELNEMEIKEFEKALQEKYPEGDYGYVQPKEKDLFHIFAKGPNAEEDDFYQDKSNTGLAA